MVSINDIPYNWYCKTIYDCLHCEVHAKYYARPRLLKYVKATCKCKNA